MGTRGGAAEIKAHPFFARVDWAVLRHVAAPNVPKLEHELDTQNFERFEEDGSAPASGGGKRWTRRADPNFVGFTYKNITVRHSPGNCVA